jgi:carbamoyl-phosphate synthase large subunit
LKHVAVKEAVFPFIKFPGVDIILGPEMRSTGEVMGIDNCFGLAFAKSQIAAGMLLPLQGTVLITVTDRDKKQIIPVARDLAKMGYQLMATSGTAVVLGQNGIPVKKVNKLAEGRLNIIDHIKNGEINLIINTPLGRGPKHDEYYLRREATMRQVPIITTIQGAVAALEGIKSLKQNKLRVRSIQEYHKGL